MGLYSVRISSISISVSLLWLPSECDGWWYWHRIQSVWPAALTAARSAASQFIWLVAPDAAYALDHADSVDSMGKYVAGVW